MTVTRTIAEQRTVTLLTLQEYADQIFGLPYRQTLKTIHEALAVHGWDASPFPENYKPKCCGTEVSVGSFLGSTYRAECEICHRFILDVTGPTFGNSWASFPDPEKVDLEADLEHVWIASQAARP
jgi:hypothetical protein